MGEKYLPDRLTMAARAAKRAAASNRRPFQGQTEHRQERPRYSFVARSSVLARGDFGMRIRFSGLIVSVAAVLTTVSVLSAQPAPPAPTGPAPKLNGKPD